jgi:hypothetical protein
MRITYKCRKCRKKLEINPNLDQTPNYLREIIVKSLLELTENDYCYNCCDDLKEEE